MSGKNSIQVAIKVRPLLKKDKDQPFLWRIVDNSIQLLDSQAEPYYFDHIFDQDAKNEIIFDKMAKQIVHSAIQGFNGTIFAYGQTSSGKTYTMMGDEDNPGVMVLAAKEIFKEIERTQDRQFLLRVGYIEIYNEKIYDLLNKKNQDLKIHESNTGIVSVNCAEVIIRSEDDLLYHLDKGGKERTVGETNMNERSSRSHAIFRIIIESRKMERSADDAVTQSVINLVDLAGSERADQTGARGTRLKEGGHINKSLLFLSNVIKRLSENEDDKYISFRDSKLTRILQASLGGNALTAIICTIKPNALEETQSTLSFALRAKAIKNKPQVNEIVSDATMMKRLEHEIKVLKIRLEEEQRKNESQIKVRQLEQRIKNEDLKIISCNSLHSIRSREKRRRTWCPSSTNLDASALGQQPSALPVPAMGASSRFQQPRIGHNTPLITIRVPTEPPPAQRICSDLPPADGLPEIDEEFAPAELVNFEMISPLQTPHKQLQLQSKISITPKLMNCTRSTLEKVEHDLFELQSFTNLENKVEVQHEPDLALKQKVETLSQRNAILENERLEYLQLKNEFEMTTDNLNGAQKRCDELQIELSKLKDSNKTADEKIAKYEAELAELKKTNEKLEMENREAVNLEFELKRHKNKSKLREHELLEALNDKEKQITKLEKSLNALSAERLQNTKEELLQKSLNEGREVDEDGKVCIKCEDLQRLLEENNKITAEFEKLTLECEKLKLNYIEIEKENESKKLQITQLEELHAKEKAESEKLLLDVQQLKEKLQTVQRDYDLLSSENSLKHEECMELNRQVEVAKKEMVVLEEKFTKLELSWQEQQQTIKDIETQYATIQTKYENLQIQYEQLEATKGQSSTDCQRLEKENLDLQTEIEDLKKKVNDAQQKLLESNAVYEKTAKEAETANEENSAKTSKVQQENEQLKIQLLEIQTQFEDLQKECDDLSNQLMDNIQDCDYYKNENSKLKEKLKDFEGSHIEVAKAEAEIHELRSQLENELLSEQKILKTPSPIRNSSMRSSGVCIEEEDFVHSPESQDLLAKFCELSESLSEIELEHSKGKTKLFKSASKNSTPNSYKMYLKNIMGVHKTQKQFEMEMENIHLQGSFKHHSFHIVEVSEENQSCETDCNMMETNDCANMAEYIEKLKEEIIELNTINEQERLSNKSLLESTERALSEMREQINQLSAELLEKSIFVENCSCKIYQQQIENLEKEKADITLICEELQDKVNSTLNGSSNVPMNNNTSIGDELKIANDGKHTEIEKLKLREKELLESYDSQAKTLEEMTQRCIDMEAELETALEQLKIQEREFKEQHDLLQLEILQKLELSANEYRDNMKKYNKEWEEKRDEYEQTIKDLQNQIEVLKQTPISTEDFKKPIKHDNISDSNEIPNKMQTLECAVEPPSEAYQQGCDVPEDIEEIKTIKCKLEEDNLSLQQKLNTAENLMMEMKDENHTQYQEITLLESKLVSLEELLTDAKLLHINISRENASLKTEIDNFEEDQNCIPELHDKNQQLSDEVERLSKEYSELQDKLQKAESKIHELCKDDTSRAEIIQTLQTKAVRLTSLEEEKQSLANDFENLKQEHTQVQEKLHLAEVQIKEFCQEEANREELLKTLQSKLGNMTALESKKVQKDAEFENLKQEYATLQEKLQNAEEQIQDFCREQAIREELVQTLQTKLSNLTALEKEKGNLKQEYELELQDKLHNTEVPIQELCLDQSSREELIQTLQTKLSNMAALEEEKGNLETDLENLKKEYAIIQEKLQNAEEQTQEFCREQASREELIQTLQTKLSNMTALEEEKGNLETDLENLKKEYAIIQEKLQNAEEQTQEFCREQASREELIQTLQTKLSNMTALEEEKGNLETDLENLKKEYAKSQDKLHSAEEKIKEFCLEVATSKKLVETLQTKLCDVNALEEKNKNLEIKSEQLNKLLSCLQEKESESFKEIKFLKQENESLNEKMSELINNETRLQSDKLRLEEKLRTISSEYSLLQTDKILLESEISNLTEETKQLLEECSALQEEKTTLTEQLKCLKEKERTEELLEQIINEKAELAQNLRLVTEKLEVSQNKLEEKENQMARDKEKKLQIEQDLQSIKASLTQTIEEKHNKLEDLEREIKQVKQDNINLNQDLQALKQSNAKAIEEKQELQQKTEEFKKQVMKLEMEKQEKQLTLEKANQEYGKLQHDLKTLKESLLKVKEEKQQDFNNLERSYQNAQHQNKELQQKLEDLNADLITFRENQQKISKENTQLQTELQATKESLAKLNEENQNLQEKLIHYQNLQEENNKLEIALNVLKKAETGVLKNLQKEKEQLQNTLLQYKEENEKFREKEETLKLKIESLSQQLHEMRGKAYSCEKLLLEHEELEGILTSTTAEKQKLQQEISQLTSQQETCASQIENLTSEVEKLNLQLSKLTHEKQMLQTKLTHLKETLQGEQSSLQKEHNELKSSFEELKLKYDSLQVTNKQLENLNKQIQQQLNSAQDKLKEFNCVQEELNLLKVKHTELKLSLKTTVEEAERCSVALRQDVNRHKQLLQQQLEKYNLLKVEMETKQDSLSRTLSANIETLQNEKRSLEEKLRALTVRNFEQDLQRQAIDATANTSADSNTSHSPRGRKSLERLSIEKIPNISLEEKLSAIQQKNSTTTERKNRRLNTHDERRRQSSYWGAAYDKETMTDPVDTSCNCIELDQKLKDCERNLFIKTSQVTALSMELKNHPLKEENASLKKRLQEEQNKHSIEIKRYKSKLYEQTEKAEKAAAAAAHAAAKSTHAALAAELQVVASPVLPKIVADVGTQTDDELSACIQKLQGKYNDLKNICRHRYNVIKELEEKVAQKENTDGNSLSVLDSAQFKVMSNQYESMKKEMAIVKEKYEFAKQVLQSRREEIAKLRAQLEQTK